MADERFVTSADGTVLRLVRSGSGPSCVLVHGTMGSAGDFWSILPGLSSHCAVTAYDRRGRGGSGDSAAYGIEREIEDLGEVIATCDPPVTLVGHSFGAVVSLLTAARDDSRIARLVLYEPPVGHVGEHSEALPDELDALVAAGHLGDAVRAFGHGAGITDAELDTSEANASVWAALRDAVPTAAREIRAAQRVLPFGDDLVARVVVPTLVLLGASQDHPTYGAVADLARRLARGELARVPGHHLAHVTAPDAFVEALRPFITNTSRHDR